MARNMKQILLLLLVGIALFACKEEAIISTPEVVTGKISEITVASFAYEGNVVSDGGMMLQSVVYAIALMPLLPLPT